MIQISPTTSSNGQKYIISFKEWYFHEKYCFCSNSMIIHYIASLVLYLIKVVELFLSGQGSGILVALVQ